MTEHFIGKPDKKSHVARAEAVKGPLLDSGGGGGLRVPHPDSSSSRSSRKSWFVASGLILTGYATWVEVLGPSLRECRQALKYLGT